MEVYREYIEVTDDESGQAYTAEVRMCHDFPEMMPNGGNQVAIFDERVAALVCPGWSGPITDTFSVLAH